MSEFVRDDDVTVSITPNRIDFHWGCQEGVAIKGFSEVIPNHDSEENFLIEDGELVDNNENYEPHNEIRIIFSSDYTFFPHQLEVALGGSITIDGVNSTIKRVYPFESTVEITHKASENKVDAFHNGQYVKTLDRVRFSIPDELWNESFWASMIP